MRAIQAVALAVLWAFTVGVGCKSTKPREIVVLSTARVAPDFGSYRFSRVGILPVEGEVDADAARQLQRDLFTELSRSTPYELVILKPEDLYEVRRSEPVRRGAHHPETLVELSRRYRLDGVLFPHVAHRRLHLPLEISLHVELVASDTGQVVWSSSVHLDAADERVRHGLEGFFAREHKAESGGAGWEIALLAPVRFARFAAYQVALQL